MPDHDREAERKRDVSPPMTAASPANQPGDRSLDAAALPLSAVWSWIAPYRAWLFSDDDLEAWTRRPRDSR